MFIAYTYKQQLLFLNIQKKTQMMTVRPISTAMVIMPYIGCILKRVDP